MQGNYQNFDRQEELTQNGNDLVNSNLNRVNVFNYLAVQILYSTGWMAVFIFTNFGSKLLFDQQIFAITFSLSGTITIFLQSLLLYLKQNNVLKQCLGIIFLIINGFFVAYLILMIQFNIYTYLYDYIFDIQDWYLLVLVEILMLIFILVSQNNQKFRWIIILILPALLSLITGIVYFNFLIQFQIWLLIFCVACLYMTQTEQEMGEFYLSLNILGFITLFLIKTAQYVYNTFQNQTSVFVTKLQEQKQLQFIFLTYMIAAISTLLSPSINLIFEITNSSFFCISEQGQYGYVFRITSNFWIILGFNYFTHLLLYLVHRFSKFVKYQQYKKHIKSLLALAYFVLHQLSLSGFIFAIWCRREDDQYFFEYLSLYYYLSFLQLQFVFGAITLQIKQKFCLKSLYHALIIIPIIANFVQVFFSIVFPTSQILIIIVNSFLIIYMGQSCLNEDNFFLQFKEDEIMISGALLSDPLALFIYQSVFVHIKAIKS